MNQTQPKASSVISGILASPLAIGLGQDQIDGSPPQIGPMLTSGPHSPLNFLSNPKANNDWRSLFQNESNYSSQLQFFKPKRIDGKVVVQPAREAVDKGIAKWESSLIGQFLNKAPSFLLVKRFVEALWGQYGLVEVFALENAMFLFHFPDTRSRDFVLEARLWHIANKPIFLRKWQPRMQFLDLSLRKIPIWIKILHLPVEY